MKNFIKDIPEKKIDELISKDKNSFLLEKDLIDYYYEYGKNDDYKLSNYQIKVKSQIIFFTFTIDKNFNFNYFGMPINFFYKSNLFIFNNDLKKLFRNINKDHKFNFNFKIAKDPAKLPLLLKTIKHNEEIFEETFLDLKIPIKEIFKQFSKGHRYEINRSTNLKYEIIDWNNYKKGQIIEMMNLHEYVSKKKTRSKKSWLINEKMIENKKGFLIFVKSKDKVISASFFFNNQITSSYFSSCTIRDYFIKTGITHKTIWLAVKYLKEKNCCYLYLGRTKTYYSNSQNIKEKNIEKFKHSFGGKKILYQKYDGTKNDFEN